MQLQIGKARRRRAWLVLALSASLIQVLGCMLPTMVLCHKDGRPPRLEFFSDSCSCSQADALACPPRDGHDAPCLENDCTDVPLKSHVLLAAAERRPRPAVAARWAHPRPASVPAGPSAAGSAFMTRAESPPPLPCAFSDSRLRC